MLDGTDTVLEKGLKVGGGGMWREVLDEDCSTGIFGIGDGGGVCWFPGI